MTPPRGREALVSGVLLACLLCAPLAGRQSASISGLVIDDRGEPVPGARVGVARGDPSNRTMVTVIADAGGRFAFDDLPAATYTLALSKPGHVNTAFGRAFHGGSAIRIPVRASERREVVARLPRGSVIAGVVRGDDGAPLPGAQVRAARWVLVNNQRSLWNVGSSIATNSRGEYRIWNLPAGRYFITAWPPTAGVQIADMRSPDRELRRPPRYYPGVNDPALAQTISVSPGVEVPGIDIGLATEPAGTLVVNLVNPTSMTVSNIQVGWHPAEPETLGGDPYGRRADEVPGGGFVMRAVPVGRHVVTARANVRGSSGRNPQPLWASLPVWTTGGTDEISLMLGPGATIAGRILSRDDPRDLDIGRIRPAFLPVGVSPGEGRFTESTNRDAAGHFEVAVPPGEYRLAVYGLPAGWIVTEAVVDGRDVLDGTVVVGSGDRIESMAIVVSHRPASLAGTVVAADGAPAYLESVVLFPLDHALRRSASRWIRAAQPDIDGRYAFDDLPPGEYFIAAASIDWNPALETDRLQALEPTAQRITLRAGEELRLDLTTVSG